MKRTCVNCSLLTPVVRCATQQTALGCTLTTASIGLPTKLWHFSSTSLASVVSNNGGSRCSVATASTPPRIVRCCTLHCDCLRARRWWSTASTLLQRFTPPSTRCQRSPIAFAAVSGKATPVSPSRMWSTSVSVVPISDQSWPMKHCASTRGATWCFDLFPMLTAPISLKQRATSTRLRLSSSSRPRHSPPWRR